MRRRRCKYNFIFFFPNNSRNNVQARAHEKKGSPVLKEAQALVRTDWPENSYLCPFQSILGETFTRCKKFRPTFSLLRTDSREYGEPCWFFN